MEQPEAISSSSMQNHALDMTSSRSGSRFDRSLHPPFQAIIEKGRQAKAQVEQDQYEARKAKRESEIKNAARIRHAEAEANRRRVEESKLSIDDHKGKLLDEMTTNIKAMLENKYREEIRTKVYENEDRIVSAYEQDVKDQTKARLVKELESVVKAKLEAEFEPEVKRRLAVELAPVVKTELRAEHVVEVKQQLVKDLGPEVEIELRARYETEVKQQLTEELQSEIEAELRAQYGKDIKNHLIMDPDFTIIHNQKSTQTDDVQNELRGQRDTLERLGAKSSRATPNHIDTKESEYPDLSHYQHLISQNGVHNDQQEAASVQDLESTFTDRDAVLLSRGTKRSLSGIHGEEEDLYARRSKRSRSASSNSEKQQLSSRNAEGSSAPYPSNSHSLEPRQGERYNGEDGQGLSQHKADDGYEAAQGNNGYPMDFGTSGYDSSSEVQRSQKNTLGYDRVDYNSAKDVQGLNGSLLDHQCIDHDGEVDVQLTDGNLSHHDEADFNTTEGPNGNFLSREEADYDSAEDFRGGDGDKLAGQATESYDSEDEDGENEEAEEQYEEGYEEDGYEEDGYEEDGYEEEYESEEEEQYSTTPQAGTNSKAGNGVISFCNTQDTAFVLSDSEDEAEKAGDEDQTLVGYGGPAALIDAKHYDIPAEETLFLDA